MGSIVKVFMVDDHYMVIEGIQSILKNEPGIELVGHATNGESCLAYLRNNSPDLIFMDINLPGINGIDLCKEVRLRYPSIFIIGLSTFNQQSFIEKMMNNGASGYVLKNATRDELVLAIETVMKGKTFLSHEAAMNMVKNRDSGIPLLTRREKEVLELISEGLTNQEIAEKLFISISTVDTHRKNLLAKFDARNVAAMVRMAGKLGVI
jgi:DNA-binding NarL/FixJ family response regulator